MRRVFLSLVVLFAAASSAFAQTPEQIAARNGAYNAEANAISNSTVALNHKGPATSTRSSAIDLQTQCWNLGATTTQMAQGDGYYSYGEEYYNTAQENFDDGEDWCWLDGSNSGYHWITEGDTYWGRGQYSSATTMYINASASYTVASTMYNT